MLVILSGLAWTGSIIGQCGPAAEGQGGGSPWSGIWMIALIFIIFYFLLIRPQQKKQKEHQKLMDSLTKGDKVVTSGGIYGTVIGVKEGIVVLKIAEEVKIEVAKSAVTAVIDKAQAQ
jgi:preprotein translocase subunit YajC